MTRLDDLNNYGKELREKLFLTSYPLAVRMLEKEEDIPPRAQRPLKDLGWHVPQCQAFAMSRRNKMSIAVAKEDSWCPEPVIGYGLAEPPEFFLEGHNRYPGGNVETLDAGRTWAQAFPRLEYGKYTAIVSAPLAKANFEPDLLMIYCDSIQLTQLLKARTWIDGRDITCRMSGHGACVHAVVPVIQTKECQVTFPCFGDRRRAFAQDDEIIFSAPIEKIEGLIVGLKAFRQIGLGIPIVPTTARQPQQLKSYAEIARMVGMVE